MITLLLSGVASVIAVIIMIIIIVRYNYTLTYYAFPQGDIALAMNEYAEVRSATRAIIGYENEADIEVVMAQHDEAKAEVEVFMAEIEKTLSSPDEKASFEKMNSALEAFYAKDAEVVELGKSTDSAQSALAQQMAINELTPLYNAVDEAFTALMDVNVKNGDTAQSQLLVMAVIFIILIVILIFIAFIISNKLSAATAKGIIEPMHQLIDRLNGFAHGDISSPFPENDKDDEIGDMIKAVSSTTIKIQTIVNDMDVLLGKMAEGNFDIHSSCEEEYVGEFNGLLNATDKMTYDLSATLNDMKEAADMVSAGSTNLAEASQALAEGATDQAASIEELQAMVSEISSSLGRTTEKANDACERADQCVQEVEKSRSEMEVMVDAMNKISETSQDISGMVARETESVKEADLGIIRISEVVQSNSATAQETSATSEELSVQAISMDEIVANFILKGK